MKKVISICNMIVAIILMATPFGVAMTFAPGPGERSIKSFSYFNIMPLGYGNWFPIITAILTISILFLLVIDSKNLILKRILIVCLSICIICSPLSWLLANSFTAISACVVFLHVVVLALQVSEKVF